MYNIFFIGDSHFGHKKIISFESTRHYRQFDTIEQHDEELIKRWNSVVKKNDLVWHLGDFCFGSRNLAIAARLNGRKKLVMGNHDTYPTAEYLKYFEKVYGAVSISNDLLLSHIPIHPSEFYRWKFNIHGHLHDKTLPDERYINVSAEQINLTPISLEDLYLRVGIF